MTPSSEPFTILISSPLEAEQIERIRAFDPARYTVVHVPELLPTPRYVADHNGAPRVLTDDQHQRWNALLREADILFDFDLVDPANLPAHAPKLRWVQGTSAGIGEFLKRTGLDASGIVFTTAAGVHARPLAEFALLGLLYFFRDVPHLHAIKARHHWERYTVRGLEGARVLVVGLGSVGGAIARDCAHFGMEVWGTRRRAGVEAPKGVSRLVDQSAIRAVLPEIDALVIACPLTDETRLLIDAAEIAALKPGAVLVNVGRGAVVNEVAMIEALTSGHIRGAAIDAFTTEPLPKDNPLWDLPNVLISPHSASTVAAENGRIVDIFLDNLGRFAEGRPLRNQFERDRGY